MAIHGRRWLSLAGAPVLAFAVAVVAAGCSESDLSQMRPGKCISGEPYFYPPDIEVIDCTEVDPTTDTMVVFAESAAGDSYPGNLEEMNARCAREGGFLLKPSSEPRDADPRAPTCGTDLPCRRHPRLPVAELG